MIFHSAVKFLGCSMPPYSDEDITVEPMLFNCDYSAARRKGGPITNKFLDLLPDSWKETPLVVDTRVHMLMPGWYPAIPGWHLDDVPRTRGDHQPNFDDPLRSEHCVALVNGWLAPTEFACGNLDFSIPEKGSHIKVYESVNEQLNKLDKTKYNLVSARNDKLVIFNDRCWHRAVPATGRGWRWFGRVSRYSRYDEQCERPNKRTNALRKQTQIYLPAVEAGW
ncbi:MAG: hypothetical protein E6R03_05805 [Hyphomicrobiaceae bacterium]|nr:MAG: hypothetical protein E6R03_05805 [Hyphomicrobiaceae bacterium]